MLTYEKLKNVAQVFGKRGFAVQIFETAEAAKSFFLSSISASQSIAYGGSKTLSELNIIEELRETHSLLIDRNAPNITAELKSLYERQAFSADIYLASANAVALEGALVNIDKWGNRTAAIEFGPKKVYLFIGRNKICSTLEEAIKRARNVAAVKNCLRFNTKTPCVADGQCHNCASPERICAIFSIIERSAIVNRIELLLINQDLGF